jgi:hypothetical protein
MSIEKFKISKICDKFTLGNVKGKVPLRVSLMIDWRYDLHDE